MSRKNKKLEQRKEKQRLRDEQLANEPASPLTRRERRKLYRNLFTCQLITSFLYKLVHSHGLMVDNYVRITPRYIIWHLLEEYAQSPEMTLAAAA